MHAWHDIPTIDDAAAGIFHAVSGISTGYEAHEDKRVVVEPFLGALEATRILEGGLALDQAKIAPARARDAASRQRPCR